MSLMDELERQRQDLAVAGYATTIAALVLLVATAIVALFTKILFLRLIDDQRTSPWVRERKRHYVRIIDVTTVVLLVGLGLTVFGAAYTGTTVDRVVATVRRAFTTAPPGGISAEEAGKLREQLKAEEDERAPWSLNDSDVPAFIAAAKKAAGTTFDAAINDGDPDGQALLLSIEPALTKAGWKQVDYTGNSIRSGEPGKMYGIVTLKGLAVVYHTPADGPLKTKAEALKTALEAAKLPAQVAPVDWKPLSQGGNDLDPTIIHLLIGKK